MVAALTPVNIEIKTPEMNSDLDYLRVGCWRAAQARDRCELEAGGLLKRRMTERCVEIYGSGRLIPSAGL